MDIPVTLIVKAPNQQFEDQTIKCELSWTIKRLKGYLSEVYPCKPSTDEQKLIYSGQLLHDAIILKDVLRAYEEEVDAPQIHTVHLVYTPKYKPKSITSTDKSTTSDKTMPEISTTDGIRHRNIPSTSSSSNVVVENQSGLSSQSTDIPSLSTTNRISTDCSTSGSSNSGNNTVNNNLSGMQNFMNIPNLFDAQQQFNQNHTAQQLAMHNWMQQAYMQYLNQYMNLMQMGASPEAMFSQQTTFSAVSPTAFYPQNIDPLSMINQPQSLSIPTPQVQPGPEQAAPPPQADGQPAAPLADGAAPGVAPQPQNQPPAQPRFPNIVIDDNQDNRDWLDRFYTVSRLILFITLIYFYSSPVRCLLVLIVGIGLYLYNAGMFRMNGEINNNNQRQQPNGQRPVVQQQPRPADNNNNPVVGDNNNNVVDPQYNERAVDENDRPAVEIQNNAATIENSAENHHRSSDNVETRSIISFIRTFVVSFFTSLIPEPPAL